MRPASALISSFSGGYYWLILVLLSIGGIALLSVVTNKGIGLGSDSAVYISASRNLTTGQGLSWATGGGEIQPMTHFPPFYSLVLSIFELFRIDAIIAARIFNCSLFGINILMIGTIVRKISGSQWFSILGVFLATISIFMIRVHSWAMSEPLYLVLAFGGLYLLANYLENNRRNWLIFAGIALGLAYLTRYVGVSLIVVGLVGLLSNLSVSWRRRMQDTGIFLLASMPLNLVWMLRNEFLTGHSTSRSLRLYLPTIDEFLSLANVALGWFIPARILDRFPDGFLVLGLAGFSILLGIGIVFWLIRGFPVSTGVNSRVVQPWMAYLLALHVVAFLGVMGASTILIYPPPALDFRIFIPLHVTVIILVVVGFSNGWQTAHWALRSGVVFLALLFIVSYTIRGFAVVTELLQDAQGYSASEWQSSELIAAVKGLPQQPLYSNQSGALYLLAGRPAYTIPYHFSDDDGFDSELGDIRNNMMHKGAFIVLFYEDMHSLEELTRDLILVAEYEDGVIYSHPGED